MVKKSIKIVSKAVNMKTHTHPLVKNTSGGIQGNAHLSQRDAYAKSMYSAKTKNAKTSGAGWGGEKTVLSKKK